MEQIFSTAKRENVEAGNDILLQDTFFDLGTLYIHGVPGLNVSIIVFINLTTDKYALLQGGRIAKGVSRSVGGDGRSVGADGRSIGGVGRSVGGDGRSVGGDGRSVGGVGRSVGGLGRSVGRVSRSVGRVSRSIGRVSRSVGGVRILLQSVCNLIKQAVIRY